MKNKVTKIISIVLGVWLGLFIIDLICINTISRPVFMIKANQNDKEIYYGIGYKAIKYDEEKVEIGTYFLKYDEEKGLTDQEKFYKEYNSATKDNVFVYRNVKEITAILKNGTGVVYIGFPECKWCQAYVKYLSEVANDIEIDKIYYFNILEDRQNNTKEYQELLKVLGDTLQYDEEGKTRVYVPHVSFVIEGKIIGTDYETSKDTKGCKEPNEYWNDKRVKKLKEKLTKNMKEVYDASMMCTSCNE